MIYICLLRGINVSGQKAMKMAALRTSFESLGLKDIMTYVQSGNVVFSTAAKTKPASLGARIKAQIATDFGFDVPVVIIKGDEMGKVVKGNPFVKEKGIDMARLYVTFLSAAPEASAVTKLKSVAAGVDRFHVSGTNVYLHCPKSYGETKLSNNTLERVLSVSATTRNWKTVTTLHDMTLPAAHGEEQSS